jgi:hypothetical protein
MNIDLPSVELRYPVKREPGHWPSQGWHGVRRWTASSSERACGEIVLDPAREPAKWGLVYLLDGQGLPLHSGLRGIPIAEAKALALAILAVVDVLESAVQGETV